MKYKLPFICEKEAGHYFTKVLLNTLDGKCVLCIVAEMLHRRIHSNLKCSIRWENNKEEGQ